MKTFFFIEYTPNIVNITEYYKYTYRWEGTFLPLKSFMSETNDWIIMQFCIWGLL